MSYMTKSETGSACVCLCLNMEQQQGRSRSVSYNAVRATLHAYVTLGGVLLPDTFQQLQDMMQWLTKSVRDTMISRVCTQGLKTGP